LAPQERVISKVNFYFWLYPSANYLFSANLI
jgi:hypothetical protein